MSVTAYVVAILCLGSGYFLGLADGRRRKEPVPLGSGRVNLRSVRRERPTQYTNTKAMRLPLESFTQNELEGLE